MEYSEVIRRIIEKQEDTIGMIARQKASQVENIEIDGDEISFRDKPGPEEVESLMDEYKEIQGKGAVGIARKAISDLKVEGLDLPEELQQES